MKQNVRFSGLNLSVDEQAVENGALAVCDGMEVHNGALRPCVIEGEDKSVINGEILYIHELTNGRKNAVFAVDDEAGITIDDTNYPKGTLMYQDITDQSAQPVSLGVEDQGLTRSVINSITSNGNTLVLLTVNGMKYFRWYNNTYKYLGDMPELELEFSLREGDIHEDFDVGYQRADYWQNVNYLMLDESAYEVDLDVDYTDSKNLLVREEAMDAALGKAKQLCHKKKYFTLPFFVRYCYRLWDGRKIMHSAPVLLFSDITHPEAVIVGRSYESSPNYHWNWAMVLPQKLHLKVWNSEVINTIKDDWKDIIKSIDVYITPEISRRDETITVDIPADGENYPWSGKWEHLYYDNEDVSEISSTTIIGQKLAKESFTGKFHYAIALKNKGSAPGWLSRPLFYFKEDSDIKYRHTYGIFQPKEIGEEQWKKRLAEQNAYYLLKRYDLTEGNIPTDGYLPIDDDIIDNIEAQEQMITSTAPDDYRTHNEIIATQSYVYNNRINLTGIEEIPFRGFPIYCLVPDAITDGGYSEPYIDSIIVRLEEDGKNVYVQRKHDGINRNVNDWFISKTFIFFPDTRAKEMWVYSRGTGLMAHFTLTEHPFLNGAYHMGDIFNAGSGTFHDEIPASEDVDFNLIDTDPRLPLRNYIFTSASGNPFVYPAAHRYAVGMGEVKAIASTTRALSQGQFGQYPLIAFATDGIYALEVSSTGSYSGIQPISREVITNANALLQLDQSVAFITKRAISQLIESDVNDLSTQLSGPLRDLSTMLANLPPTKAVGDLIKAVQSSDAIYDFVNKRLLYFLMEDGAYTGDVLTFSANDNAWAFKSLGNVVKGVYNSYPYPYIHKTDGTLICLSEPYDNKDMGAYSGLIVSRTLKSEGYRNAIREFIQDYDIDEARPMLMLWGSDDNRTWHYIGKSNARQMGRLPGRIYKYFRLAVQFENLKRNDLYHGVTLDIVERFVR